MIEHADTALERWLSDTVAAAGCTLAGIDFRDTPDAPDAFHTSDSVERDASTAGGSRRPRQRGLRAVVSLQALAEQLERRDRDVVDIRDRDGRVTARQRSLRWFELDYRIALDGDAREAHRVLGALVQSLVDDEMIAADLLPESLAALSVPIEIELRPGAVAGRGGTGLAVRLVVPAQPRPDLEIAEPVRELDLEMSPPPAARGAGSAAAAVIGDDELLLADRRWTTVRRRERIAPSAQAAG